MKIKSVYIHSFRGIPNELTVNFTDKTGKPVSTIISGDNGSGKSSIVDAIKYNLQGRICRESLIINSESKTPISYFYSPIIGCNTKVELDNGIINERGIDVRFNGKKTAFTYDNTLLIPAFCVTPIALRRSDIISFNIIPKDKRQILFFSFLYQHFTKIEDVLKHSIHWEGDEYVKSLSDKYVNLKQERKNTIVRISELLEVKPEVIPYGEITKFNHFINSKLNIKGFSRNKGGKLVARLFNKGRKEHTILKCAEEVRRLTTEIKKVKDETEKVLNPHNYGISIKERREQNAQFIKKASEFLSESFVKISNLDFIDEIYLELGDLTSASLEITVRLKNGKLSTPNQLFSEANYDLMVLLLYISLIRAGAEVGQAKVMILDDVLQSVDSVIRAKFLDYILGVCKDWQFVITCHDDLWLNQMRFLFVRNGLQYLEYKLSDWSFEHGPKLFEVKENGEDTTLKEALATNNKQIIASQSGLFLEKICQKLSVTLPISVKRTFDDKYTIGDLWPGINKTLKSSVLLRDLLSEIDRELMVRNMMGCHANEWSQSMSDEEVKSFAKNVQTLYEKTYCQSCQNWITTKTCSGKLVAECRCRELQHCKE